MFYVLGKNQLPDWLPGGDSGGGKGPGPDYGGNPGIYPSETQPQVNEGYEHQPRSQPSTKQAPNANQGGVRVLPPGVTTDQHGRTGRDSPGYGDLGIRHFGGSGANVHDISMDSMGEPPKVYSGPGGPNPARGSGYDNRNFHGVDV